MLYVTRYAKEDRLWTVGYYGPDGKWNAESDHETEDGAAERIHYLMGGSRVASNMDPRTTIAAMAMQGMLAGPADERKQRRSDRCEPTKPC